MDIIIPDKLQNLLVRIGFYSSVKGGEKICFESKCMVPSNSILNSCFRLWYGEGASKLLLETNKLITESGEALLKPEWKMFRYLIFAALEDMYNAITLQINVYSGRSDICTSLNLSRVNISRLLDMMNDQERAQVLDYRSNISLNNSSPSNFYTRKKKDD